jgi:hypothetical protein
MTKEKKIGKIRRRWNRMSKKQKIITSSLLSLLFLGSGVFAIWYISLTETASLSVTSDSPLSYTHNWNVVTNLDSTNKSVSETRELTLINEDGLIQMNVSIVENKTDVNDSCTPDADEVTGKLYYEGSEIVTGDIINITHGQTNITLNFSAERFSCPSSLETELTLLPIS